jgi:hypothetical protein
MPKPTPIIDQSLCDYLTSTYDLSVPSPIGVVIDYPLYCAYRAGMKNVVDHLKYLLAKQLEQR